MSEPGQNDQSSDNPTTSATAALPNTIDKIAQLKFCTDLNLNTTSKLTLERARKVDKHTPSENTELKSSEEVLNYIFQTLMIANFNAREFELKPPNSDNNNKRDEENDNSNCFEESENEQGGINPMDALLAIFYCSEDALRQYLVLKLSACQLSVPFLLPDHRTPSEKVTILLSALKDIQKCWNMPGENSAKRVFATEHPFPVVSFIRVGKPTLSKSFLINKVMSEGSSDHEFFFHKNLQGGHVERKIVDGLVELAWFLPGRSRKTFKNAICFSNLRGDARNFKKQRDLLLKNSSVLCILSPSENPDEIVKSILEDAIQNKAKVILIFNEMLQTDAKEYFKDLTSKNSEKFSPIMKVKCKNDNSFFQSVREKIQENIYDVRAKPLVELASCVTEYDIQLDDDHSHSEFQKNVDSWLQGGAAEAKNSLKLQAHVPELAHLERERVNESSKRFEEEMDAQKKSFRHLDKKILDILNSLTEMNETERNEALSNFKHQLDKISLKESQFSFGLEHVVRELAQLYQIEESKHDYAGTAADMLLSGQPLEILDGDSFYIPMEWFHAVFTKLQQKTNNAKLFVISVLGIQSSGKSTMLNTMFGLKLPVSVGRCTRGAFASLIPVSDSLKPKLDYILVIDTKGLSGSADPQLLKRDNELTTFAIGVADLTIVNIFGENIDNVKGFLEIAVHALLKMKLAREGKSFKIVHQNVAAVDAEAMLRCDRGKLKVDLDEMTKRAAIQENCEVEIKGLDDIISFDESRDVFYIPALHQGNPPMALVNPEYGRAIQRVKGSVIELMCSYRTLRVSHFGKRVSSLWGAMQKEHFIFSFRNEIEIRAHKSLERKYFELTISRMGKGMNQLQIMVESALKKCSTQEERDKEWAKCLKLIDDEAEKIRKEMEKETADFFQSNEDRATLEQWSEKLKKRMEEHTDIQVSELKKRCLSTYNHLENLQDINERKHAFEAELQGKVKEFVRSFQRGKYRKTSKEAFNEKWQHWVAGIPECQEEKVDVNYEMMKVLCAMESQGGNMREKLQEQGNKISNFKKMDLKIDINDLSYDIEKIDMVIGKFTGNTEKKQCVYSAGIVMGSAVDKAIEFAESKLKPGVRCTPNDFEQMYHEVINILHGKERNYRYKFSDSLRCDIILHAFAQTYEIFEKMEESYIQERDIRGQIEKNLRPRLEKYVDALEEKRGSFAATSFVEILQKKIELVVNQTMGSAVAEILVKENKFTSKGAFHASVLIELGEKFDSANTEKSFETYVDYLQEPVKFLSKKLQESIKTYCAKEDINLSITKLREDKLKEIKEKVLDAIKIASKETIDKGKNVTFWILRFVELCPNLLIGKETFGIVAIEDLESIEKFTENVIEKVTQVFKQWETRDVNLEEYKPHEGMFLQMFACQKKCPFCDALCDESMPNHPVHSTPFHRPSGVAGRQHQDTKKLSTAFCTRRVAGTKTFLDASGNKHKYRDYKTMEGGKYSSWNIPADKSYEKSKYWQWFFATFTENLAHLYGVDEPSYWDMPGTWKRRKFREGKAELQRVNDLHVMK